VNHMRYTKYTWVGNRIAEAVSEYIKARGCKSPAHENKARRD
jgi:hypothetical protein